jgi:RNA-directed DNA polymerase
MAGVLEDGHLAETEEGTPQGAVISPLLANIYLHYVYDLWVHAWRTRHATGDIIVVRYADDAVVLLRQLFLPPCHFAGEANDHIVFIGLSVNRDGAECSAFDSVA